MTRLLGGALFVLPFALGGDRSDPGLVRYYKKHYRVGCDRWSRESACNCFRRIAPDGGPSGVFVDCSNLGLVDLKPPSLTHATSQPTPLPTPLPTNDAPAEEWVIQTYPPADVFYANGNSLTHIDADTFGKQPNLKYLYLHNNPNLVSIAPGAFRNMTNLRELLLHYTALELLPAGIFDDLPNLKILWVHNTGNLRYVAPGVFSQLHRLQELRLENNNLNMSSFDYNASKLWPGTLQKLFLTGNERLVFQQDDQSCCSLCGVSKKANVKAENALDFRKACKVMGKGKGCGYKKERTQTLACGCSGNLNCGGHCAYAYPEECSYWQLNVGGGAATRANLFVTLAVSMGALLATLW